ncbi:hypothetical protein F4819DRAFT_410092 [Hypoxylon fuscum]|nr:hypothetical protein F4819DRAFT_410092 [Hypoxylon fuscum]
MAHRASQADLTSAYTGDVDINSLFGIHTNSITRRIPNHGNHGLDACAQHSPSNSNIAGAGSSINQQQQSQQAFPSHQLPSFPDLFAGSEFAFESFPEVNNFIPPSHSHSHSHSHSYYHHIPPATNYNNRRTTSSWALGIGGSPSAFSTLDSALREREHQSLSSIYNEGPVAPPRTRTPQLRQSPQQNINIQAIHTTHAQLPHPSRPTPDREPHNDDYYLAVLGQGNFSSPSLPPINSSPLPPSRPQSSNLPKPLEVGERVSVNGTYSRQGTSKTSLVDLTKDHPASLTMPATRKRTATATANANGASLTNTNTNTPGPKRRRSSASSPSSSCRVNKSRRKEPSKTGTNVSRNISPFIDSDDELASSFHQDDHETIDLSNVADVPEALLAPKVDKRTKLGKFQCVICMDDCANLTVTHCGHLFCSECLHSALHIDNMKKTCPVCRTKVDPKDKRGKSATRSYYHLELKIMTANKKGKRPAGSS